MKTIPFEDNIDDILGKARGGLKMTVEDLANQSGLPQEAVNDALKGKLSAEQLDALCPPLNLSAGKLKRRLAGSIQPAAVQLPDCAAAFNTPFPVDGYEEMTVNAYLLWDPTTRQAVAFDCGSDVTEMLAVLKEHNLKLEAVLLTHTHADHIAALDHLIENGDKPRVWVNQAEDFDRASSFHEGRMWQIGCLMIRAIDSHGHSPGGTTFYIEGLNKSIAIVGDSIFACSVGGAPNAWDEALTAIRRSVFLLPENAIVCPGHGPMTTVGDEKRNNPFFTEFS